MRTLRLGIKCPLILLATAEAISRLAPIENPVILELWSVGYVLFGFGELKI